MGLKKYEIITVGSDKRVRALRSWAVGGRYVNIGDVGGIVYDEKTLSQDGACWLFRGNFGFPGARIGGDSIVDVGEAVLPVKGSPAVDILGSSVVVGPKLLFESEKTSANAVVLTADDFESGAFGTYIVGQPLVPVQSANYIRTKNPIFLGGRSLTVKAEVPGYTVAAASVDKDGLFIGAATAVTSGVGVTLTIPAGQYAYIRLGKDPVGPTVPADAAAAQITFTGTYETKLSIIDSRVEINPATSTGTTIIKPGGTHSFGSGDKYPEAIIRNSNVSMVVPAVTSRSFSIFGQIIESTATLDGTTGDVSIMGQYRNVKNLTASGALSSDLRASAYNSIQATNCDNFKIDPAVIIPAALTQARAANMPFIFQGCNVPNGVFYHHVQIKNTYKNIDFAKAQADLGKSVPGVAYMLVSSETEGMYRIYNTAANLLGFLVESYDSISSIGLLVSTATSYGTTIYKDAYVSGKFDFAGTNVFGNTKKYDSQDVSGCKIVNTGATAVDMKGNIRVEGNATLTNCSVIGSGYFGGKAVASGLLIEGSAFMSDNASFTKTAGVGVIGNLKMKDNGVVVLGDVIGLGVLDVTENARLQPTNLFLSEADLIMSGNALVTAGLSISGILRLKDNAKVAVSSMTAKGDITVCGSYSQSAQRRWFGKRVIDNENAPEYDNNVKTQYDF